MATVITKVLVRIGDHDVLFVADKDGVLAGNILIPNENGLKVIRDHYGYTEYSTFKCFFENLSFLLDGDDFLIDTVDSYMIIDTEEGDE